MLFGLFLRLGVLFFAMSLIYFGLSYFGITQAMSLGSLAKLLALSLGAAVVIPIIYPFARGIRKGDKIQVIQESGSNLPFQAVTIIMGLSNGTALENGRVGNAIKVELIDKSIAIAKISKYEGFISNAEAQILQREIPIEIRK